MPGQTTSPARIDRPATATKKPTSRDLQRQNTRRRIIDSALKVFAEKGFGSAGTREIAAGAGVRQALINHYFKTKEGLWQAAITSLFEIIEVRLHEAGTDAPGLGARARVRKLVETYVRFSAEHPEHGRLMLHAGMLGGPLLDWLVDTHLRWRFARSMQTIEEAIAEGLLPDTHPVMLHYMLNGASQSIFLLEAEARRLSGLNVRDPALVERHVEAVLGALGLADATAIEARRRTSRRAP